MLSWLALAVMHPAALPAADVNAAPPGVLPSIWHNAAGIAKYTCMNVFIARQPVEPYQRNIAGSYLELTEKSPLRVAVDRTARTVTATVDNATRVARYMNDQGCIIVPNDGKMRFQPVRIASGLPPADRIDWPLGDRNAAGGEPDFNRVADITFDKPQERTAAVVVIHNGKIVAERYAPGSTAGTLFHGWSATKSIQTTMMAVLEQQGRLRLYEPAGFPEWQSDARREIRLGDALRMSSGLKCRRPQDYPVAVYDDIGYPEYQLSWTDTVDAYAFVTALPAWFPPGTYAIYKDCDPAIVGRALKRRIGGSEDDYLRWPQRELFDKIGIRSMRIGTDASGNMLGAADGFATARDWARLGLLWANGGVAPNGEKLISDMFQRYVRMRTPAWQHDRPYGAGFWISSDVAPDAFSMLGGTGQMVTIVPSLKLVVVRLAHDDLGTYDIPPQPGFESGQEMIKAAVEIAGRAPTTKR